MKKIDNTHKIKTEDTEISFGGNILEIIGLRE
jgi:hypothetical protein